MKTKQPMQQDINLDEHARLVAAAMEELDAEFSACTTKQLALQMAINTVPVTMPAIIHTVMQAAAAGAVLYFTPIPLETVLAFSVPFTVAGNAAIQDRGEARHLASRALKGMRSMLTPRDKCDDTVEVKQ